MNHCVSQETNLTSTGDPLGGHQVWQVVLIVLVTAPLSLVTIVGNLLVLVSFRVNTQLRTISNYYLLSLAVADLILGAVSMNLYAAYIIMGRWTLGNLACDAWLAVDYVASNASVMNLLVISFDRYFSVTRPLTYRAKRTARRAVAMIALAWTVSFVLWGPAILFWPHLMGRPSGAEDDCSIPFLTEPSLTIGTAVAAFYLPASIMVILYWRIYWEIEKRAKGLVGLLGSVSSSSGGASEGSERRLACPSGAQGSLSLGPAEVYSGKGDRGQGRKGPVGCFPGRQKLPRLVAGRRAAVLSQMAGSGSYGETCSNSSWNVDDEEDEDGAVSSSTEEEREPQGTGAVATNPAVIKLRELPARPKEESHKAQTSLPRAADSPAGRPCPQSSLRIARNSHDLPRKPPKGKRRRNMIIREKKAARTLSAILLAFILTWTPYNIMVLASISYCLPENLWHLSYWLCYINSTVNPMCYALCNKSFRVTFKALLLCRHGDQSQKWAASHRSNHHHNHASIRPRKSCSTV